MWKYAKEPLDFSSAIEVLVQSVSSEIENMFNWYKVNPILSKLSGQPTL